MQRSWGERPSSPSGSGVGRLCSGGRSDRCPRGQVEPLAALAAILAVGAALAIYGGVLADVRDRGDDRETVEIALENAADELTVAGVARPGYLSRAIGAAPEGWRMNVTLRGDGTVRQGGPEPPTDAERASRPIGVRTEPGRVGAGELRVVLWR